MLGRYGLDALCLVLSASVLIALPYFYSKRSLFSVSSKGSKFFQIEKYDVLVLLGSIGIGILYFCFPTEFLLGGRDQGVYAYLGVFLSKTGGFNLENSSYDVVVPILGDSVSKGYPGVYSDYSLGISNKLKDLTAQFYHLYCVYLAIGYDLFGIQGLLRVNGIFGLLSVFFASQLIRPWIGKTPALLTGWILALNPAQIWNIRTTLTEPLSQFLILFSLFWIGKTIYRKSVYASILPGLILGLNCLNRIDSLIIIPALSAFCLYLRLFIPRYFTKGLVILSSFLFVSVFGMLYGYFFSYPYFMGLWSSGHLRKLVVLCSVSTIGIYFLAFLRNSADLSIAIKDFIRSRRDSLRVVLLFIFLAACVYGYFLRPNLWARGIFEIGKPQLAAESFPIFLWYVPVFLFVFCVFGFDRILFRSKRVEPVVFLSIGSVFLLLYLYDPSISPDHFWVSRRWILFSIPFALISGSIGVLSIPIGKGRTREIAIGLLLSAALIVSVAKSRLFLFRSMLSGYAEALQKFSDSLDREKAFYFTTDENLAGPLRFQYGLDTSRIGNTQDFLNRVEGLLHSGFRVYLIQNTAYFGEHKNLYFEEIGVFRFSGEYPIGLKERYPDSLVRWSKDQKVFRIHESKGGNSTSEDKSYEWKMGEGGFFTHSGTFGEDLAIYAGRKEGALVYGPFITLPRGKYELTFKGNSLEKANFQITAEKDKISVLDPRSGANSKEERIRFDIPQAELSGIEFKVWVPGKSDVIVRSMSLRRIRD